MNAEHKITLREAAQLFLDEQRPTTARSYSWVMKFLQEWVGPARPVARIQPQELVEFIQSVRDRPAVKSPATVNKYSKTLKTFFNWCIRMKYLDESPADALRLRRTGKTVRKEKAMTDEEFERLLDFAKWHPRNHALVLFLADTGCRSGGAAGLRVEDIDFETCIALVTEKGDKQRRVWFGPDCAAALQTWLKKRNPGAGPYVFQRNGEQLSSPQIGQTLRRMCIACGIRSLGSHSLRHRKGHQLADARIAPTVAATALGHESVMTTLQHYYPRDDERAEAIMRQLTEGYVPPEDDPPETEKRSKIIDFKDYLTG